MSIFQPKVGDADSDGGAFGSIPLPPVAMGVLGAMFHGNCKTTRVPEGQWTSCNDGFSMLEREGAPAAWALGLRPGERQPRNFGVTENRDRRDTVGAMVDCGRFECAEYWEAPESPEIREYVESLSPRDQAGLLKRVRAWRSREIRRELEQARAENTALHARLKEMAAYEAGLDVVARAERH